MPRQPHPPRKVAARAWTAEEIVDGGFFLAAGGLVVWLGWILAARHPSVSISEAASLVVLWALVAYVGLPRLQQVLAKVFVPDYFVGRTVTASGILGDPVNLAVDGTEAQLHAAMERAGWTRADDVTLRSSWGIIVSAVARRSYRGAPVSPLFAFGQQQAFAYEQEVDGNASQRHHVRFWPTPAEWVLPGGRRVDWIAAGTYDRKVGLSLFTLQVTHKIDADIDAERDHVVASLRAADGAVRVTVLARFFAPFHARNGGGDVVRTDGNLPVLDVSGVEAANVTSTRAVAATASRRLPPIMLLLAGVLSGGKALATLLGLLVLGIGADRASLFRDESTTQLAQIGAGALVLVALWLLTLTRRRWARTLLMAVCTVDAVGQLAGLHGVRGGEVSLLVLLSAGLSVLILITVSSDDARRWVSPGR